MKTRIQCCLPSPGLQEHHIEEFSVLAKEPRQAVLAERWDKDCGGNWGSPFKLERPVSSGRDLSQHQLGRQQSWRLYHEEAFK